MSVMLDVQQLGYHHQGLWLFRELCFQLAAGESVQICGANGSGKTTLLQTLLGLKQASAGSIDWQIETTQPRFCYIGHQTGLKLQLSVWQNLYYQAQLHHIYHQQQLETALKSVDLFHCRDRLAYQLSAGQQRRLSLALLTLTPAAVWILDEPATALDKAGQAWLREHVQTHLEHQGALIFTSHQTGLLPASQTLELTH